MFQIDKELESEVARNRNNVQVGDVLYYIDCSNCARYRVTEVFDGGFEAIGESGSTNLGIGVAEDFYFSQLQKGWCFAESTKQDNRLYHNVVYV